MPCSAQSRRVPPAHQVSPNKRTTAHALVANTRPSLAQKPRNGAWWACSFEGSFLPQRAGWHLAATRFAASAQKGHLFTMTSTPLSGTV